MHTEKPRIFSRALYAMPKVLYGLAKVQLTLH